ncbi:MAG: hypothetical protein NTX52_08075 [Planctomycetota bacterium]|nr:hypothetical protein [Planctomycetota bacterium]
MRLRDLIIWSAGIIVAAALLIVAGTRLDYINSQRQQMKLITNSPLENAPPSLAFATVAMGAFRGLVVDVLWMRADRLKEQGQFFDARQLAEWITTLQPRFASVWEFQAWNMAYNISVAIPATQPDQRWRWVKNGYELLRDQGIPLNPKSIALYHELARIFQHKIGSVSDDAHKYYKLQLAMAMEPLLGPADNQYFDALAEVASDWQQIVKDPNVILLITALKSADSTFSDNDEFVSNYLSLRQNAGRFTPAAAAVIDDFRGTEALRKFDIFARAYQLRKVWKLDPVLMRQLNKTYGPIDWADPNTCLPLDWRHPDSHAIYWAIKGLQIAAKDRTREIDITETNTDRIIGHSLQNLFRNGKIFIYDVPLEVPSENSSQPPQTQVFKDVFLRPDLRMFEPYNRAVLAVLEKYKKPEDKGAYESLQNGHRNMLKNAVLAFYQAGHKLQAQKIYDELRQLYPLDDFKVQLVEFARKRFLEELDSIGIDDAKEQILSLLREGYFLYAIRDDDQAFGREKMAQEVYDYYRSQYSDENRIDLPKFKLLRYLALIDFLNDQQYPPYLRGSLLDRIKVERPELLEQLEQQERNLMEQLQQSEQTAP